MHSKRPIELFCAVIFAAILSAGFNVPAQQTPPVNTTSAADDPLNDRLLQATDEDSVTPNLFSRVTFKYDHLYFSSGADGDRVRLSGLQTLGPRNRLAIGYEIPYFNIHGGNPGTANGEGLSDIKIDFNYLLGKNKRFSNAVRAEFTFPSASNDVIGLGQNIVKAAWGFSTPLTRRTVFSGILAYNKGMTARSGQQGFNTVEPEVVLTHKLAGRVAGFLDWDAYQDFNADRFGQLLKGGLTLQLDRKARWNLTPYGQFALNHFTASTNLKSDVGFDLDYRY